MVKISPAKLGLYCYNPCKGGQRVADATPLVEKTCQSCVTHIKKCWNTLSWYQ